jgi:hypothetical protein
VPPAIDETEAAVVAAAVPTETVEEFVEKFLTRRE